jgi:hypothetical protein
MFKEKYWARSQSDKLIIAREIFSQIKIANIFA